jgi:hypothetical protein
MASLFGIRAEALPGDWNAFTSYVADMFDSPLLGVDSNALALGKSVLSGVGTWLRPPYWYCALTAFWMPPRLRAAFELPLGDREEATVLRTACLLPALYPRVPHSLRFVGPFHEAEARLQGRAPSLLTRRSNRFWMGQPLLLFAEQAP